MTYREQLIIPQYREELALELKYLFLNLITALHVWAMKLATVIIWKAVEVLLPPQGS